MILHELLEAQAEVNEIEAQHASVFANSLRPFVGWTCGVALAFFVVIPLAVQTTALFGRTVPLARLDSGPLLTSPIGMLCLAGYRTLEKGQGRH
jgi:hypothetical protein